MRKLRLRKQQSAREMEIKKTFAPPSYRPNLSREQAPSEPYPDEKMYWTSLKSSTATPATAAYPRVAHHMGRRLQASQSLDTITGRIERLANGRCKVRGGNTACDEEDDQMCGRSEPPPLARAEPSTVVQFFPENGQAAAQKSDKKAGQCGDWRGTARWQESNLEMSGHRSAGIASHSRRASEVASWAMCGAADKSARDYLW